MPQVIGGVPVHHLSEYLLQHGQQRQIEGRDGTDPIRAIALTTGPAATETICGWAEAHGGRCDYRYSLAIVGCAFEVTEAQLNTMLELYGNTCVCNHSLSPTPPPFSPCLLPSYLFHNSLLPPTPRPPHAASPSAFPSMSHVTTLNCPNVEFLRFHHIRTFAPPGRAGFSPASRRR